MIHTNKKFSTAVEKKIQELELSTDAEIVVVASERSGTYLDLAMTGASGLTFVLIGASAAQGVHFSPLWLTIELAVFWSVFSWLFNQRWYIRLASSQKRRQQQVQEAAAKEFHIERVHSTPNRTGILIYISALEGEVILMPDSGVQEKIADGRWSTARTAFCHSRLEDFLEGLTLVGEELSRSLPKQENDDIDLPNSPRIRS